MNAETSRIKAFGTNANSLHLPALLLVQEFLFDAQVGKCMPEPGATPRLLSIYSQAPETVG
jgi:hypothetical protein